MNDEVYFTPNHQTSSWIIDDFTCRIQTSDPKTAEQVASWSFATLVGRCVVGPTRIFSIPRPKWRWALKRLGIHLPRKEPNRVISGLKTSRQNFKRGSEDSGQKILLPLRRENLEEPRMKANLISIAAYRSKTIRKIEGR
jgi:hypothetical protein